MTKEKIKTYLTEQGASEELTRKPAVMERIYALFNGKESKYGLVTGNFNEMINSLENTIRITKKGNIIISDEENLRIFKTLPNNEALYINNDNTGYSIDEPGDYYIDKYGMDKQYISDHDETVTRNDNGTIETKESILQDNGSPIINLYDMKNSQDENTWKLNKEYITESYPNTAEWFITKKTYTEKNDIFYENANQINEENYGIEFQSNKNSDEQDTRNQDKIETLKNENDRLKQENDFIKKNSILKEEADTLRRDKRRAEIERNVLRSQIEDEKKENTELKKQFQEQKRLNEQLQTESDRKQQEINNLKDRNQNLQKMLKQTLDFCEKVRNSFLGRFFFGSKLKQLPSAMPIKEEKNILTDLQNQENNKPKVEPEKIIIPKEHTR